MRAQNAPYVSERYSVLTSAIVSRNEFRFPAISTISGRHTEVTESRISTTLKPNQDESITRRARYYVMKRRSTSFSSSSSFSSSL